MRALADFTTTPGEGPESAGGAGAEGRADGAADSAVGSTGGVTLTFSGPMVVSSVGLLDRRLRALDEPIATIDLSQVEQIDTVGAWTAWRLAQQHGAKIVNCGDAAQRLIDAVGQSEGNTTRIRAERLPVLERVPARVGELMAELGTGSLLVLGFLGQVVVSIGAIIQHPRRFRQKALVRQMELVGVSSLPIIGLMSFLIGIVIAQQGAVQLRQFGAEIYTVNLVGRLTLRELGVLMTAIMVAGRSGSAFAAQIGTMKLTEEVDAMRTIGVSPMEALVIPRIMAAVIMMPLLGIYASAVAIIGGAFLSTLTLGIPFLSFLSRIQEVVPLHDVWVGVIKAPVFGLIIAVSGCYQGMQVKGNAEEVGLRTTSAVVMAIFMVIVLDAFFAVFFTNVGWG
ncbi:ABC transporter permease [Novosphingobium lentum]|uniref:ABC transporter permease n=1 Tax=Novosphingobium lentum TaxID=145287 RepID=UPI000A000237|nr:ABC transporter permease [Novosphingobium lentum]